MEIRITYIGTLNGIKGMWCGFKPNGAIITEERSVLYSEENFDLIRIADEENMGSSVWLKDGDVQENYREEEHEKPEEEDGNNI